jgi:ribonuclease HI
MSKRKRKGEKQKWWPEPLYVHDVRASDQNRPVCRFFVDGACSGNHHKDQQQRNAGFGVYCEQSKWTHSDALQAPCSNNRAELKAVVYILDTLLNANAETLRQKFNIEGESEICIIGDNQYALKIVTEWLPNWRAKNYLKKDGSPVLNIDLVQELEALLHEFDAREWPLSVQWVRAHLPEPKNAAKDSQEWRMWHGNDTADRLARKGGEKPLQS